MKRNPDEIAKIKPGSIVQVAPDFDNMEAFRGKLAVVRTVHTWGVVAEVSGAPVRLAWNNLEPTGGAVVFDENNQRVRDSEPALKHHP